MRRAIRFTSAAVLALFLANTSLKAIDLGRISSLNNSADMQFDDIVQSSKQKMYLLDDADVKTDAAAVAAVIGNEAKGTEINVLEVDGEEAKVLTSEGKVGYLPVSSLTDKKELIFNNSDLTKYADADGVEVKSMPSEDSSTIGTLNKNDEIHVTGTNDYSYWRVETDSLSGYVLKTDMMDEKEVPKPQVVVNYVSDNTTSYSQPVSSWNGAVLTPSAGTIIGPSGKETYYNLNMSGCVSIMNGFGYSSSDYWVRSDGVKMLGDYVMVAANLTVRPRGSLVATSLGTGIVVDTGGFAAYNPTQLDIAVAW